MLPATAFPQALTSLASVRVGSTMRKLKELGTEFTYIEVPGGLHSDVIAPNLAAVIEFFDARRKTMRSTSQPQ